MNERYLVASVGVAPGFWRHGQATVTRRTALNSSDRIRGKADLLRCHSGDHGLHKDRGAETRTSRNSQNRGAVTSRQEQNILHVHACRSRASLSAHQVSDNLCPFRNHRNIESRARVCDELSREFRRLTGLLTTISDGFGRAIPMTTPAVKY